MTHRDPHSAAVRFPAFACGDPLTDSLSSAHSVASREDPGISDNSAISDISDNRDMQPMSAAALKALYPCFGGKARIASAVWQRFGRVNAYVEPFCGSCAVLLANPQRSGCVETVNDADAFIANFLRATRLAAQDVAAWADSPVSELDLIARHRWLCAQEAFIERMKNDPDYCDAKIAGWWLWGQCAWIGSGWGSQPQKEQLPHLGNAGMGINRKLPHLGDAGRGINRRLPHLGDAGMGTRRHYIEEQLGALQDRLRDTRIACGDWTRVLGPSVTFRHGICAVFLDPPYADAEHDVRYSGGANVWADVCRWCEENGGNPLLRIALCGYQDTWQAPAGWAEMRWKAPGGYGSQGAGRGRKNCRRETVWFSPSCWRPELDLFAGEGEP